MHPLIRYLLLLGTTAFSKAAGGAAGSGAGYDTSRLGPSNADCKRQIYQLNVTSNNIVFKIPPNPNDTVITSLTQTLVTVPNNFSQMYQEPDLKQVTKTYALSETLCTPKQGAKNASHVQYLIHGAGFDSSYWDFAVNGTDEFSYVAAATEAGYITFRYDRLGTGLSEKPVDGYNDVQAATDLAIATKFAEMLRNGDIGGTKFSNIVGVGHSYGSIQIQAITATQPTALDSVLLTGFSINTSTPVALLTPEAYTIATEVFPERFSKDELSNSYLATLAPQTQQIVFWFFPFYSPAAFDRSRETEQPVTQGVLFTLGTIIQPAPNFTGPVHVVTAAQDWLFCFLNCYNVPEGSPFSSIPEAVQVLYPAASNFSVNIPENCGHAINTHSVAPQVYQEMLEFVDSVTSS